MDPFFFLCAIGAFVMNSMVIRFQLKNLEIRAGDVFSVLSPRPLFLKQGLIKPTKPDLLKQI
ncbi:MAG: hypothetical protein DMG05_13385 [Acidobacteria bacterium]|nr:MAG: hypothetical protein DMG05_13385 [Acidobacteriota bacterium]